MRNLAAALFTLAGALSFSTSVSAQSIVTNGGFESGSLSGWSGSVLTNPYSGVYCPGTGNAPEGGCEAFLGTFGTTDTLSQILSTVAGQAYTISFAFQSDGSAPSNFSVSFGGQQLYSNSNVSSTAVQSLTFSAVATSSMTVLAFDFNNDPGYFVLDAVSVSAVPEPASFMLALLGLSGLAVNRRWSIRGS